VTRACLFLYLLLTVTRFSKARATDASFVARARAAAMRTLPACTWCLNWNDIEPHANYGIARPYNECEMAQLTCPRGVHAAPVAGADGRWPCCDARGLLARGCIACAHGPVDQPWPLLAEDVRTVVMPADFARDVLHADARVIEPLPADKDMVRVHRYDWRTYARVRQQYVRAY